MKPIPTLNPTTFWQLLISDYDHFKLDKGFFNDFFIQDISKQAYKLKLPLPPHKKTVNDIILLTDGEMTRSTGLDNFKVEKNSLFILPEGLITTTSEISNNLKGFYLHFSDSYLLSTNSKFAEYMQTPILKVEINEIDRLTYLLKQIERIYNENFNLDLIKSYLYTFLTEINYLSEHTKKTKLSTAEGIVISFKKLLANYCTKEHTVEFYANKLNITPNHLNKITKSVLNKSSSSIINEMLILEAKVHIHQSKQNIGELAFSLGFEDPSYFGRFFKKQTGYTPTEFAKMIDLSE